MCDASAVVMCALYRYQQTSLLCAQKRAGAVRYVSMQYGENIIIDKSFKILKPDSLGCLAFLWAAYLLLNIINI